MKTRYKFLDRRLNSLDNRWYYCWYLDEAPEICYTIAIDEFWRQA